MAGFANARHESAIKSPNTNSNSFIRPVSLNALMALGITEH
jgi:hypothetical protein